jgi:glycosyltransferase involved in cell wall biosynthesis
MEKIKVLHIIKSLGRGGAETLLPETLKLHDRSRFEFHYVYFLPWKNQMADELVAAGGKVTCIAARGNISMLLSVRKVVTYIRQHRIDILHAHLPWSGILARYCGLLTSLPVIYTEHNKQERYHVATRLLNLSSMNMIDVLLAVSHDVALSVKRHKPNLKATLRTISNGVNTEAFDRRRFNATEIRRLFSIPDKAIVIGSIAVFRDQKRLDTWLRLAAEIIKSRDDVHFILVGDGPNNAKLRALSEELKIGHHVHMPGLQTEVRPFLASFDIFMMASLFEGLPIALLEAMAMECAIASTDAGGIKEVVRQGIDGLLCSVDQVDDLLLLVGRLLDDADLRRNLGLAARVRIQSQFDMRFMVSELEEVYSTTVSAVK